MKYENKQRNDENVGRILQLSGWFGNVLYAMNHVNEGESCDDSSN